MEDNSYPDNVLLSVYLTGAKHFMEHKNEIFLKLSSTIGVSWMMFLFSVDLSGANHFMEHKNAIFLKLRSTIGVS